LLGECLVVIVSTGGVRVTLDLYAKVLVVVQGARDVVESGKGRVFELGLIPSEIELLFQLELVALDDEIRVSGAAPIVRVAAHRGATVHTVRNSVPIGVGTISGAFRDLAGRGRDLLDLTFSLNAGADLE